MRLLAALFLVAVAASDRVTAAPAPATYSRLGPIWYSGRNWHHVAFDKRSAVQTLERYGRDSRPIEIRMKKKKRFIPDQFGHPESGDSRPLEIRMKKKKRFIPDHFGHPESGDSSSPSKRPLEIRMKKKRFVPGHFGHPLGGLLGQGLSPAMKQDEEISAIREQTNKVVDGLIKLIETSIANGEEDELREIVPELFDEERMKKKWTVIQDALRWG